MDLVGFILGIPLIDGYFGGSNLQLTKPQISNIQSSFLYLMFSK